MLDFLPICSLLHCIINLCSDLPLYTIVMKNVWQSKWVLLSISFLSRLNIPEKRWTAVAASIASILTKSAKWCRCLQWVIPYSVHTVHESQDMKLQNHSYGKCHLQRQHWTKTAQLLYIRCSHVFSEQKEQQKLYYNTYFLRLFSSSLSITIFFSEICFERGGERSSRWLRRGDRKSVV